MQPNCLDVKRFLGEGNFWNNVYEKSEMFFPYTPWSPSQFPPQNNLVVDYTYIR